METTEQKAKTRTKWILDQAHSRVSFRIRHMMFTVVGEFETFEATIISNGHDLVNSIVSVTIDAASISTEDRQRDTHLKGVDFFEMKKYPMISFQSRSFKQVGDDEYVLRGTLEIKGVKKEVELDVEFGGISKDGSGNEKIHFAIEGKINRKHFGFSNTMLGAGSALIGDEVRIVADVQFRKEN